MNKLKEYALITAIVLAVLVGIGGCVKLNYWSFKQKYPNAGVGSFILNGLNP